MLEIPLTQIGICLLALAWVSAMMYYGLILRSLPSTSFDLPLLLVLTAMLICDLFAVDWRNSVWRILIWCGYLGVFYLALSVPRRWVGRAATVVGWAVALVCVAEFILTRQRTRLLGNPNITAAWLLSLAYLIPSAWPWMLFGVGAILSTGSRGAFLALMGTLGMARIEYANMRVTATILVLVTLCFVVAVRPSTALERLQTWGEALRLFWERPLVGWGPGCYPAVAGLEHPHADNFILTVAAEMGLVGLAAWGWLLVAVGRLVVRSEARARFGLAAWGIHNLVDDTLWWPWVGIFVMVCLAHTFNGAKEEQCKP
jgi:O-antigen ligase